MAGKHKFSEAELEEIRATRRRNTMPGCGTTCMNAFLPKLSEQFPDDRILFCRGGASRHKSKDMIITMPTVTRSA